MDYLTLLTLISALCGIIDFFCSKFFKSSRLIWAFIVSILTFVSGWVILLNSELERINNIHRQATAIYEHYTPNYNDQEFIQEALTFLEENKDRYPDAYKRACQIYSEMKNSEIQYYSETAIELRGLIKGIATINQEQ